MIHHRPLTALALVAATVAASGLAAPLPSHAADSSPFGINIHAPQGAQLSQLLDRVQAAGIGFVRIDFVWETVETARGTYDWSVYDAIASAAQARGIAIYATLAYTPAWATQGLPHTGVPANPTDWSNFCQAAASRYRSTIRFWGLWNEPNLGQFWSGTRQQFIDVILKPGAAGVHAGNPQAMVGGPELSHLDSTQWYFWLRDALQQAGGMLDFVSHHVYDSDGNGAVNNRLDQATLFGGEPDLWGVIAPSVKDVLKYTGWYGRPFWLTETGWQSGDSSEAAQAAYYTRLLTDWFTGESGRTWISKVFFYELEDSGLPGATTYGILHPDATPKPAYGAYHDFIASSSPARDDAHLIAETVPTSMETTETVTASLTFQNTGTTTWTAAAGYKLGAAGDRDPFSGPRVLLAPGEAIAPGQQKTFTLPMTAPAAPGSYTTGWQVLRESVARFGDAFSQTIPVAQAPPPGQRSLSLFGSRFGVSVAWRDPATGHSGFGRVVEGAAGTDETGFFWFFDPANTELVVKLLDGRSLNGDFWFFYGALTNVEYWVDVTDRTTGQIRAYHNPPGNLCGQADTSAFPGGKSAPAGAPSRTSQAAGLAAPLTAGWLPADASGLLTGRPGPAAGSADQVGGALTLADTAPGSGGCTETSQNLCLLGSRFAVTVSWRTADGQSGQGTAVPGTDETGTFWFFDPSNTELVVKVLDGRSLTGHFWFFYGALSDVDYRITLTDTLTGTSREYHNPAGNFCGQADTAAL